MKVSNLDTCIGTEKQGCLRAHKPDVHAHAGVKMCVTGAHPLHSRKLPRSKDQLGLARRNQLLA
jgi:hypothetical protein